MTQNFIQIDGLPKGADLSALVTELRACDQIRDADYDVPLAVDAGSVLMWVQIVSGVMTSVSLTITAVQAICDILRKRGLQKAELKFANGTVISVENASADELRKLLVPTN